MASDSRPLLARALDQTERLGTGIRPDQLDEPTPCAEFDVRALLGHVLAVLRRVEHVGRGGDAAEVDRVITGVLDWPAAFAEARAAVDEVWSDDALLDSTFAVPWAAATPGRDALTVWAQELATHSWDLARATGRTSELDPVLGEAALDIARRYVPEQPRGGDIPFEPVVVVPESADAYTRLAGYLGRAV